MEDYQTRFDDQTLANLTTNTVLENRAEHLGDDPFIYYGPEETSYSYREVDAVANAIGRSLRDLGVEKQDRVSVMMESPIPALFSMFGLHKRGAVYSPVNPDYKGESLAYQLQDTGPAVIIVEDSLVERITDIAPDLDQTPRVIVYENGPNYDLDDRVPQSTFEALKDGDRAPLSVDVAWNDTASILYTSGTTGMPKGVVHPYRYIYGNYCLYSMAHKDEDDVCHTTLPLYHVTGVYADIVGTLIAGASVALWHEFQPEAFWDRIDHYDATCTTLLSVMISWLSNQPRADDDHRNTLTKVVTSPLPEEYEEFAGRFGIDLMSVAYGSTEIGAPIAGFVRTDSGHTTPADMYHGATVEEIVERADALEIPVITTGPDEHGDYIYVGKPLSKVIDVEIVDERNEVKPPGEVGELVLRPERPGSVLKEYYRKPEQTVDAFKNLWFNSGDACYRDAAGNYFFVDRIDDVIRRRGENISSMQVQEIITSVDGVAQTAVFPVPDDEGVEDEVAAVVERAEGATLSEDGLREALEPDMPTFMIPQHIDIVDEIPTTETNKMEKYKLREEMPE
jgi:crotonobetaine/carnitine-CoA ligase